MNNNFVVDDESTLSASEFHEKFKSRDNDLDELDLFRESSEDEELDEEKSNTSISKPAYRPIAKTNDVIKKPPKDHSELVKCFRERLHLQSDLRYTSVDEQKELADVLMMAIVALWPQHRKQAANPFLSEAGNKELQRRVAVYVIETIEKLFYDYVKKAEECNSKLVFSSQANMSRLKTQILHEANRSLNVLHIRRKLAEQMHAEGGWLKNPNKGYLSTLLGALDKWNKATLECQSRDEYVRRQLRELKGMMPSLSEHHLRGPLDDLVAHVEYVMSHRKEDTELIEIVESDKSRLTRQESLGEMINKVEESLLNVDEDLNPRVVYKRADSMPDLEDGMDFREDFEGLDEDEILQRKMSVDQLLINCVTKDKKNSKHNLTPNEDLVQLVTRAHETEQQSAASSDDDFSPLLQVQQRRKKSPRKKRAAAEERKEENLKEEETAPPTIEDGYLGFQPPSLNIKVPGKNIVRICDARISNRTNASVVTLDMHPTVYNEFLDEIDDETVKSLDHHLYAGAEIQDVYNEITKTSTKSFLSFDQDDYVEDCPESCKGVSKLFMSGLLQDPKNVRFMNDELRSNEEAPWREFADANEWRNEPKFAGIGREDMLKINNKAELRRNTFIADGRGAGQLAKNYASWLTWYSNSIDVDDFKKFISNKETDYLCQMHHLYDSDDEEEEIAEAAKNSARLQTMREREKIRQQLLRQKNQYEKGFWNAQCVNLGGLGREPSVTLQNSGTVKENNVRNTECQSYVYLQDRLEEVWKSLKMPDAQRLNMAIKHSRDLSMDKFSQVVDSWSNVSELIVERENFMAKIEAFERSASDPNRFFEKGPNGSSVVRLNECKVRERLNKEIRNLELEITPNLNFIKKRYNDDVTYQGRNYALKMQSDRTEMLYWLQQERREERLGAVVNKNKLVNMAPVARMDLAATE